MIGDATVRFSEEDYIAVSCLIAAVKEATEIEDHILMAAEDLLERMYDAVIDEEAQQRRVKDESYDLGKVIGFDINTALQCLTLPRIVSR